MFKKFCYCCKRVIEAIDEKEFRKSGHVSTADDAKAKYHINTSQLHKDVK